MARFTSYCRKDTHTCQIPLAGIIVVLWISAYKRRLDSYLDVGLINHNLLVACL